jgi:hypothetical protein
MADSSSSSGKDVRAPPSGPDCHHALVARGETPLVHHPLSVGPLEPELEHDDLESAESALGQGGQDGGIEFPRHHHVVVDATLPTGEARRVPVKDDATTRQSQSPPSFAQSEFHMVCTSICGLFSVNFNTQRLNGWTV